MCVGVVGGKCSLTLAGWDKELGPNELGTAGAKRPQANWQVAQGWDCLCYYYNKENVGLTT